MIKAGFFDVGGVLHKPTLFSSSDILFDHEQLSEESFLGHYVYRDVMTIVRNLKEHEYPLGVISNTIAEHALYLTQKGLYDAFDELIFSYQVAVRKPDPQIYQIALQKIGVTPDETFYVDDLQENVDGANALGIHGIVFTSADDLQNELVKLGVRL